LKEKVHEPKVKNARAKKMQQPKVKNPKTVTNVHIVYINEVRMQFDCEQRKQEVSELNCE